MSSYTKLLLGRVEELPNNCICASSRNRKCQSWSWMSVMDQRGGVIGFLFFFISQPFVKIRYLKHSAARGRHIIKRGDCGGRERASPGPVRWTLEQ